MRVIDADALIATLRESKYMIYHANATLPIIQNNEIERCISFVETAPTIKTFTLADIEEQYRKGLEKGLEEERPQGEWIPVSERLPEKNGYYLVTTDGSHNDVIDIAEYGKFYRKPEHEYVLEWNKASKILAWMPLPEPYRKEGEVK